METILTLIADDAAKFVKNGGIVAFPTETVYGLGADVFDEAAVGKIFDAKRRPADNPLIAHIGDIAQIELLSPRLSDNAKKLMEDFFPGPLTIVLKKTAAVPLIATSGLDTIGIRMPRHELARAFLKSCSTPVVAPSANLSGRPSPTTWQAVYEDLNGRINCILQGEPTEIGLESTVVDCTGDRPIILRAGAVSLEQLRARLPDTQILAESDIEIPKSPGLKHHHYSPKARVMIVTGLVEIEHPFGSAFIGLHGVTDNVDIIRIVSSIEDYAHELFEFFRECDRKDIETIYCEAVPEAGIGAALMDRIRRAAQG